MRLSFVKKKEIEEQAKKVLEVIREYNDDDIYIDAVKLARFFGFEVQESDSLPASDEGYIMVSADGTIKNIQVNSRYNFEHKRFVLVHELAHYFLHYTGNGTFFEHRENKKGKSKEENDADYLAACLLMPEYSFKIMYKVLNSGGKSYDEIVEELYDAYRTPIESIKRRIVEVC